MCCRAFMSYLDILTKWFGTIILESGVWHDSSVIHWLARHCPVCLRIGFSSNFWISVISLSFCTCHPCDKSLHETHSWRWWSFCKNVYKSVLYIWDTMPFLFYWLLWLGVLHNRHSQSLASKYFKGAFSTFLFFVSIRSYFSMIRLAK